MNEINVKEMREIYEALPGQWRSEAYPLGHGDQTYPFDLISGTQETGIKLLERLTWEIAKFLTFALHNWPSICDRLEELERKNAESRRLFQEHTYAVSEFLLEFADAAGLPCDAGPSEIAKTLREQRATLNAQQAPQPIETKLNPAFEVRQRVKVVNQEDAQDRVGIVWGRHLDKNGVWRYEVKFRSASEDGGSSGVYMLTADMLLPLPPSPAQTEQAVTE